MTGVFDDDPAEPVRPGKGLLGGGAPAVFQEATVFVKAPVGTTLESIPAPRPPAGEGDLSTEEKEAFEACKAGMNNLHNAFWVAGKSLETMATGDLHRNEGCTNFAEFVWTNWEISESQVYRLMDEWRIGEALNQLGHRPRESQVRELGDVRRAAGDRAAVAVYDAVARTGKRVTAKLLEQVVRRLPPLTEELSPSQIGTMVRDVLTPPPAPEGGASAGTDGAEQSGLPSMGGANVHTKDVHTITSLGQDADPPGFEVASADVERLRETVALLREASRRLGKPVVRRALEDAPGETAALLAEIDNSINKIGRAAAVRRAD
ncbi:hypothetical protein AB0L99_45450 [Streptomyces sp. NPDC051954]|uniref:hypothetical protein n=1 Tax=Streptomyces sp. NPDC051954 TaxID=3155524 RepID=UPI00343FFBAF